MPTEIEILNRLINIKDYVVDLTTTEFDEENKTVRFFMVPQKTAICNHCGSLFEQVKDRKLRWYTDLFFGIWRAEVWIYKRRVKCSKCGVRSERTQFADDRSNYTRRFECQCLRTP
jgi:transposase